LSFRDYVGRGEYPSDWADGGAIEIAGGEYDL
jgi:hypothetical protein